MSGPAATAAVRLLAETANPLDVLPGHVLRLTRASAAVLHTRPMQRLVRLRQTGLGHLVWPNAENTRFSHSVGTEYWVARSLDALCTNRYARSAVAPGAAGDNVRRLRAMADALGPELSLTVAARLFALVHDFALLPLGHTLHYQLGFFGGEGAEARRAGLCLARVRAEIAQTPEIALLPAGIRADVLAALHHHLDFVECVFCAGQLLDDRRSPVMPARVAPQTFARWLPVLTFVYDLTHALFSADLIDFAIRDSAAAGIPRPFDDRLLDHLAVFELPPEPRVAEAVRDGTGGPPPNVFRFGLNAADERRHDHVITGAVSLYRVRYEVAERVFYHPAKCAADAMLDLALRRIDAADGTVSRAAGPFAEDALLRVGDDALLDTVEALESRLIVPRDEMPASRPIMPELLGRRLVREVVRIGRREATPSILALAARAHEPAFRGEVEAALCSADSGLAPGDVIFSSRPLSMQQKPPEMLIGWIGGEARTLADIAEAEDCGADALAVARAYTALWSLSVYLRSDRLDAADAVRSAATRLLGADGMNTSGSAPSARHAALEVAP